MMSSSVTPEAAPMRAISSAQVSMSFLVYTPTVGLPVVPDEAWMRTIFFIGHAIMPKG